MGKEVKKLYKDFDFSILNDNFYKIDKETFLKRKSLNERLSSGYINYDSIHSNSDFLEKAVRFLTRISYGLFEVITKEKQPNIVFNLQDEDSYCALTQNLINIGIVLLTFDNIQNQEKVDILTSICFHEMFHKRCTIDDIRKDLPLNKNEDYYDHGTLKEDIEKLFPTQLHLLINNILEDRRIEKLGLIDFPGYVFFFEEARRYALFIHSDKKFVPDFTEAIAIDYLLIKILLPEIENKFFEQIELYEEGIHEIKGKIPSEAYNKLTEDLSNVKAFVVVLKNYIEKNEKTIFSNNWKDILKETNNIYDLFPKNIQEEIENKLKSDIKYINIIYELGGENSNTGNPIELSEEQIEELQKVVIDELKKLEVEEVNSKSKKKEHKKIETHKINSKDNMSNYTTIQIIEEPVLSFDHILYEEAKKAAKNIYNNLGFIDSKFNRIIENYELLEGDLDESELYSIGFGNRYLFEEIEDISGYALDFGILLDESGSMGHLIDEAKKAVLAIILGLQQNKHIRIFCYGHTANHCSNDHTIQLYRYYNTLENRLDWRRLFTADSRSNNADGYAIEKVGEIMKQSKSRDKILCVVSDGQPHADRYGGKTAENHVKSVVNKLESEGITVIQLCMAYIENSPRMFKHFVQYEKEGKFFDNLKKILLTKLQQFSDQI